jgi:hypothetical protein
MYALPVQWADGVLTPTSGINVSGIENTGPALGPGFQLFDGTGNLLSHLYSGELL